MPTKGPTIINPNKPKPRILRFLRRITFRGKSADKPVFSQPSKEPSALDKQNSIQIEKMGFEEGLKQILNERSDRSEILQKLNARDSEASLRKAYDGIASIEQKTLSGTQFAERILVGFDQLALHKAPAGYKQDFFMRTSWFVDRFQITPENFMLAYNLGKLHESISRSDPLVFKALKKYLLDHPLDRISDRLSDLTSGQDIRSFMLALNTHAAHEIKAQEQEEKAERVVLLANAEIKFRFKEKELVEIKLKDSAQAPELAATLVEAGKVIEKVSNAMGTQSTADLGITIYEMICNKTEALRTVKIALFSEARVALPLLIDTAVYLKINKIIHPDSHELETLKTLKFVSETALEIIRSSSDKSQIIAELIAELENCHQNLSARNMSADYFQAKIEIITGILRRAPEALIYLLPRYAEIYSAVKAVLARIGINIKDPAAQVLDPIIIQLILSFVLATLSLPEHLKGSPALLALIIQIIRSILAEIRQSTCFAPRDFGEEFKDLIAEISKANNLSADTKKLKPKTALAILVLAAKIQQITELARSRDLDGARNKLAALSRKLEIPGLELLNAYLELEPAAKRPEHTNIHYLVMKSTNGNIPAAIRVLEILKEDPEIWAVLQKLAFNLSLNAFNLSYAYCFLSQQFGDEWRHEDLKAILDRDKDGKELFSSLQKVPGAIKGQSPSLYDDALAHISNIEHRLEILLFWNLVNTTGIDHRLDRKVIAARMIELIKNEWSQLWDKMIKLAESSNFLTLNQFFKTALKKIRSVRRDMADPFEGLSEAEFKALVTIGLKSAARIIQSA